MRLTVSAFTPSRRQRFTTRRSALTPSSCPRRQSPPRRVAHRKLPSIIHCVIGGTHCCGRHSQHVCPSTPVSVRTATWAGTGPSGRELLAWKLDDCRERNCSSKPSTLWCRLDWFATALQTAFGLCLENERAGLSIINMPIVCYVRIAYAASLHQPFPLTEFRFVVLLRKAFPC